jgi:hypothetical protein
VLSSFFPLDVATLEAQLDADLAAPGWPGARNEDAPSGEAIGRAVGAAVLAQAATDNYLATSPGVPPVGPGYWVSSPAAIVRSLHGARPFFLTTRDQIRPGPPPAFGSPTYLVALAEIRTISDTRTPEQVSIAQTWATSTPPFTTGSQNLVADQPSSNTTGPSVKPRVSLLTPTPRHSTRRCVLRCQVHVLVHPTSQADPAITLPIALPNHPSSVGASVHHGRDHVRFD